MNKFLIIDGNSLAFRAYYALPFLTSEDGAPTGAIFGFLNMFTKVLDEYQPTHIAVAFDFSRKTFRNAIFAEYKGTRSETPLDLRQQFPILKDLLKNMGLKVIEQEGIEADDIIGTLAKCTTCNTVILSADKDVLQLIDNSTEVWLTKKGISEIYKVDEDELMSGFGLTPPQIVDLKGLMGDPSDNIPGVHGIGPKTATSLISQFGSLENIYENLSNPNITKNLQAKLLEEKDIAFMSKKLATIKQDCDIEVEFENYRATFPFGEETSHNLVKLNMTSLLKKDKYFTQIEIPKEEKIEEKFLNKVAINSLTELQNICKIPNIKTLSISLGSELFFTFNKEDFYYISNEITLFSQPPEISEALKVLSPILEDKTIEKIVVDYKNLKHKLAKEDVKIDGKVFDLKLANYLLNEKKFDETNVSLFENIKIYYLNKLKKLGMLSLYQDVELPLENVLFDMENAGFKVDKDELISFGEKLNTKLTETTEKIYQYAGEKFNLNSSKQMSDLLFVKLKLPCDDNRKLSTGGEFLTSIINSHPIVEEILKYRKVQKLTTYVDAFLELIDKYGEIIHTVFNQMQTSTGRLSSSEPNLQNLPVRVEEGKELRKSFISRFEGGKIISADYNQIELRLLAHCSGDQTLIDAFNTGLDIHTLTASQIFNKPQIEVTDSERRKAKAVNFGIIYGMSEFGLAQNLGTTRSEAAEYIEKYFTTYPNVKKYMDENIEFAKKYGYAKTIFDRRRYIPEIESKNFALKTFGSRVAMNMPLQGSASDIIKMAMLRVSCEFSKQNLKSVLILQIHDELVVDAFPTEISLVQNILKTAMETVVNLTVPLPVEVKSGTSYYDV